MAIEITSKTKTEKRLIVNVFFSILLVISLAFLISYFVLYFISQNRLNQELYEMEELLKRTPEQDAIEKELRDWQKKIDNFGLVILNHRITTNIFALLEENTLPQVVYSNFNLNLKEGTLNLSGEADSFRTLGQQIFIIRGKEFVKDFDFKIAPIDREGEIKFDFNIILNQDIFKFR